MKNYTDAKIGVAVTGALGNLGWKLLCHLATTNAVNRLVGLDVREAAAEHTEKLQTIAQTYHPDQEPPEVEFIQCNLSDWHDRRWRRTIERVDSIVHFAADNPYPEASWTNAGVSLDMTLHLAMAAVDSSRIRRMVFATSNHVMGRYKDSPLADQVGPGALTPALPPEVGTIWHTGEAAMDSTPYATSKFYGERVCQAFAARAGGRPTFACIRIGWCQPGENLPTTLSAAGTPTQQNSTESAGSVDADFIRAEQWFKGMWLSNRDFTHLFERAILADGSNWPDGFILVNGMSNNSGMKWSLEATRQFLSYQPVDDVYA